MGTVTGYTAERMKEIEDNTVVNGEIDPYGHLILTRNDASTIDAGLITTSPKIATSTTRPTGPALFAGLVIYETDTKLYWTWNGTSWLPLQGPYLCTSATRPAAPIEGMEIYETDTNKKYIYDGAAWALVFELGAWTTYTPTDTGITVGAGGTRRAAYRLLDNKTCEFRWALALGTGSAIGVGAAAGLPFASVAFQAGLFQVVTAYYLDGGSRNYTGIGRIQSGLQKAELIHTETGGSGAVDSISPFTWSTTGGDHISVGGVYEIA